jgi:hypothetical protein
MVTIFIGINATVNNISTIMYNMAHSMFYAITNIVESGIKHQ